LYGDVLRTVTFSRVGAKHRLAAWVRLLAITAARPGRSFEAVTIGRARYGAPRGAEVTVARIPPIDVDEARKHLGVLVELWDRGMREPLPIACQSSAAYAAAAAAGKNAEAAARKAWESSWNFPPEDAEPEHQLVLGGKLKFDELLVAPPRADEAWDAGESTRFGQYARRLWDGALACEELSDR
jgi:exodeoxyribonuclease V gamma subunit